MEAMLEDEAAMALMLDEIEKHENQNATAPDFSLIQSITTAESSTSTRFLPVCQSDVDAFLENQENINTKRKTQSDMKLFTEYLQSQGEQLFPEFIAPVTLNKHISGFLLSVRRKGGEEFEPTTLRGFVSSIDRYLKKKSYGISIMSDIQFEKARNVLKMKQKQLKSIGKGNKRKAADSLSDNDLQKLYDSKTLGGESPTSLQNSMWLICTMHFGMRTGKETHMLQWGDVSLKNDENGQEYLLYDTERQTKTRTGANPRDIFPGFNVNVFEIFAFFSFLEQISKIVQYFSNKLYRCIYQLLECCLLPLTDFSF